MSLAALSIQDLRCIQEAALQFSPGLNLIEGPNGSGKTSLLEAAYLLGRGRSFGTRHLERVIRHGAPELRVFGETDGHRHRVGLGCRRDAEVELRIDGAAARSRAELPRVLFVEVIDPEIHRLVEGAPLERRRWLDWVVFHVEPAFLSHWTRYTRALRQRNAALRAGQDAAPWEPELATHGEEVARLRQQIFQRLAPEAARLALALADLPLEMHHRQGWKEGTTLAAALASSAERDRARAVSLTGPHRADVELRSGGKIAREVLSRGQQKLAAAALVLAGIEHVRREQDLSPTLLLDDPAAELDSHRIHAFAELVRGLRCQLLVTSLQPGSALLGPPDTLFHVEQGRVKPL